jgi:hypothetical protein
MNTYEASDLHQRVARYEAALEELRAVHQDIRNVLQDQVLYERWQQIGAELGFTHPPQPTGQQQQDLSSMNQQIPQMSEAWAG